MDKCKMSMSILFYFFTFINSIRYTRNTCILFQVSVCEPDLPPCSFSIFMFMKNSISFVVWKKETPNNNPAIPPTSAIIERPVTRYVSVLEYLRAIIKYKYLENRARTYLQLPLRRAMGCRQYLPLSVVQLKGKHCQKPHCSALL